MAILAAGIQDYLKSLQPERKGIPTQMEKLARERGFPILSPEAAAFCHLLARSIGTKRVLELGSGFGYSAWWFATAGAHVTLTEYDEKNLVLARKHLEGFPCEFHAGDALESLAKIQGEFDIVFCDIDKEDYPEAWKAGLPRLRKGGYFLTDNTLWHGKVVQDDRTAATEGVRAYNRLASTTPGVVSSLLPIGDGLMVSLKT